MQFVSLGLLTLYVFRTRFVSIFRSRYTNCRCSHQCVCQWVWGGICKRNNDCVKDVCCLCYCV